MIDALSSYLKNTLLQPFSRYEGSKIGNLATL